jgi:hypothetical protein
MPRTIPAATISSNNSIATNYQTELVALRAAQVANYFTVGSKAFLGDQLVGKRNGQVYSFVIRDRGEVENQLAIGDNVKNQITEREVHLSIEPWHISEKTNAVEGKTDLQFDKEIAEMDGPALIQGALKKSIKKDVAKSATCFVGNVGEFEPLSMASAHLASITSEPLYGFCDPMIEAIVTSKGAQFVPVDAPAMYKQGLIGHFHGADYRSQRFVPRVKISAALATAMTGATFASFNDSTNVLTVTLGTAAASATKVEAGTPFFIDGVVATDLYGDETTQPYAFIAKEDVTVASGAETVAIPVDEVPVAILGTRVASMEDGSIVVWSGDDKTVTTSTGVSIPAAGTYFAAIVRANGSYEFETLNDIDVATADSKKGSVEGITVHQNRMIDMGSFVNDTRFDLFTISGVIEKRAQALVLVKAK